MCHTFHRYFFWTNFNRHGVGLIISYQVSNFVVQSCTEQNSLAVRLTLIENFTYGFHESHIRHSICFIKNNNANIFQRYCASLHHVNQSTRTCNEDIDTSVKGTELLVVWTSTIHSKDIQLEFVGKWIKHLEDLLCQLAGWGKYQRSWTSRFCFLSS